jgi:hypothetical protein
MDGTVLADALTGATAQDVAAQTATSARLTPFQDALIGQSTDNIEEDQQQKIAPPASAPLEA